MFKDFRGKNSLVKIFIILFLFTQLFGLFFFVQPVYTAGAPVVVTADVPATTKWGWEKVGKAMLNAALGSVLHAASYFIRKMAYDSALWIAHGGKGQGALAFKDGGAAYFTKLGEDTAADAINQLGKPFGLNLCSTPDLQLQAFLQIGMHSLYWGKGGPTPSCTWQKMSNSWSAEAFEQKYGPGGSKWLTQNFSNALRFEDSDFGIAVGAKSKIDRQIASV
ncbi:hypothetical protein KJ785_00210, partial [Patescibacteria group bacterium]|nr:hypothetical protein [Patescibacteria group bacterium]